MNFIFFTLLFLCCIFRVCFFQCNSLNVNDCLATYESSSLRKTCKVKGEVLYLVQSSASISTSNCEYEDMKKYVSTLICGLPISDSYITNGIIQYSLDSVLEYDLNGNKQASFSAVDSLVRQGDVQKNLCSALTLAYDTFSKSKKEVNKFIVIFSDGSDCDDEELKNKLLHDLNVLTIVVGVTNTMDQTVLQQVATDPLFFRGMIDSNVNDVVAFLNEVICVDFHYFKTQCIPNDLVLTYPAPNGQDMNLVKCKIVEVQTKEEKFGVSSKNGDKITCTYSYVDLELKDGEYISSISFGGGIWENVKTFYYENCEDFGTVALIALIASGGILSVGTFGGAGVLMFRYNNKKKSDLLLTDNRSTHMSEKGHWSDYSKKDGKLSAAQQAIKNREAYAKKQEKLEKKDYKKKSKTQKHLEAVEKTKKAKIEADRKAEKKRIQQAKAAEKQRLIQAQQKAEAKRKAELKKLAELKKAKDAKAAKKILEQQRAQEAQKIKDRAKRLEQERLAVQQKNRNHAANVKKQQEAKQASLVKKVKSRERNRIQKAKTVANNNKNHAQNAAQRLKEKQTRIHQTAKDRIKSAKTRPTKSFKSKSRVPIIGGTKSRIQSARYPGSGMKVNKLNGTVYTNSKITSGVKVNSVTGRVSNVTGSSKFGNSNPLNNAYKARGQMIGRNGVVYGRTDLKVGTPNPLSESYKKKGLMIGSNGVVYGRKDIKIHNPNPLSETYKKKGLMIGSNGVVYGRNDVKVHTPNPLSEHYKSKGLMIGSNGAVYGRNDIKVHTPNPLSEHYKSKGLMIGSNGAVYGRQDVKVAIKNPLHDAYKARGQTIGSTGRVMAPRTDRVPNSEALQAYAGKLSKLSKAVMMGRPNKPTTGVENVIPPQGVPKNTPPNTAGKVYMNNGQDIPGVYMNNGKSNPGVYMNNGNNNPGVYMNNGKSNPGVYMNNGQDIPGVYMNKSRIKTGNNMKVYDDIISITKQMEVTGNLDQYGNKLSTRKNSPFNIDHSVKKNPLKDANWGRNENFIANNNQNDVKRVFNTGYEFRPGLGEQVREQFKAPAMNKLSKLTSDESKLLQQLCAPSHGKNKYNIKVQFDTTGMPNTHGSVMSKAKDFLADPRTKTLLWEAGKEIGKYGSRFLIKDKNPTKLVLKIGNKLGKTYIYASDIYWSAKAPIYCAETGKLAAKFGRGFSETYHYNRKVVGLGNKMINQSTSISSPKLSVGQKNSWGKDVVTNIVVKKPISRTQIGNDQLVASHEIIKPESNFKRKFKKGMGVIGEAADYINKAEKWMWDTGKNERDRGNQIFVRMMKKQGMTESQIKDAMKKIQY